MERKYVEHARDGKGANGTERERSAASDTARGTPEPSTADGCSQKADDAHGKHAMADHCTIFKHKDGKIRSS